MRVIHRLHGIVCAAMHRTAVRESVVGSCEEILCCRWVEQRPTGGELHWCELDEHNGELDLWTDHDETLVSIDLNSKFTVNGTPIKPAQLERLLAAALAARLHRTLWGMATRGRTGVKYVVDDSGAAADGGEASGDPRAEAWRKCDSRRSNARSAVGEDEYVRLYMESYRLRSGGGHHPTPASEVEAKLRADYKRSLAQYEGYEPDAETLLFVV